MFQHVPIPDTLQFPASSFKEELPDGGHGARAPKYSSPCPSLPMVHLLMLLHKLAEGGLLFWAFPMGQHYCPIPPPCKISSWDTCNQTMPGRWHLLYFEPQLFHKQLQCGPTAKVLMDSGEKDMLALFLTLSASILLEAGSAGGATPWSLTWCWPQITEASSQGEFKLFPLDHVDPLMKMEHCRLPHLRLVIWS